ncbi:hypothetical protein BDW74DRAFT_151968 [Aspergillus multicolor]|uniref:uncharacterized protein n=1 Tax=Aspergillus multicolor TaxID=41759 RepID=UPI003CCE32A3
MKLLPDTNFLMIHFPTSFPPKNKLKRLRRNRFLSLHLLSYLLFYLMFLRFLTRLRILRMLGLRLGVEITITTSSDLLNQSGWSPANAGDAERTIACAEPAAILPGRYFVGKVAVCWIAGAGQAEAHLKTARVVMGAVGYL